MFGLVAFPFFLFIEKSFHEHLISNRVTSIGMIVCVYMYVNPGLYFQSFNFDRILWKYRNIWIENTFECICIR